MVTGKTGHNAKQIVAAAHIVPASSHVENLKYIGMTPEEVNSVRNGLFLVKGIEEAFDQLQISFVKNPNIFSNGFVMKILDTSILTRSIWNINEEATGRVSIGFYDGSTLNLGSHTPFKRAIFSQARQAHLKWGPEEKLTDYWSEDNNSEFATRYRSVAVKIRQFKEYNLLIQSEVEEELDRVEEGDTEEIISHPRKKARSK
eukprot:gene29959-36183_t